MDNKRVTYIVEVGYNHFGFDNGDDAIRFARVAKQSFISDYARDKSEIDVAICIKFIDTEDKEEDE